MNNEKLEEFFSTPKQDETKWNVNIEPKFHNKKIEGFFISFNKK